MASSSCVSSKGQIVIPAKLRKELGLKPGVRVTFARKGRGLFMEPNELSDVLALCGKFARYPLEEDLAEERQRWDQDMEAR